MPRTVEDQPALLSVVRQAAFQRGDGGGIARRNNDVGNPADHRALPRPGR